jgi:hypothetical protein
MEADGPDPDDTDDPDALIDAGLKASTFIYSEIKLRIRNNDDQIDTESLKEIKRAALKANVSFARYVKLARAREDRLLVELHMIRDASERDRVDQEANRARVYTMFRSYRAENGASSMANESSSSDGLGMQLAPLRAQRAGGTNSSSGNGGSSSGGSNGGGGGATAAMPSGAQALQRAIASVGRVDASLAQLVPMGTMHFHGAGILANLQGADIPEAQTPQAEAEAEPQK